MSTATPIWRLFGLFAAQVTGSFVIAGAEMIHHDYGVVGKTVAGARLYPRRRIDRRAGRWRATADAPRCLRCSRWKPCCWRSSSLSFCSGRRSRSPRLARHRRRIFAAMAMGAQSVLVRLLMKGIPQTNVMTGNMTQLGVATTELIVAWRRFAHSAQRARTARIRRRPPSCYDRAFDRARLSGRRRGGRGGLRLDRAAGCACRCRYRWPAGAVGAHPRARQRERLALSLISCGFGTKRRAAVLVVEMHEMLEHPHEGDALGRLERRQDQPLRCLHRRLDSPDQAAAGRRNVTATWCGGRARR